MVMRRTAIAVPADLLDRVDRIARERGESRSKFLTMLMRVGVRSRRDAQITRQIDRLLAHPEMARAQLRGAEELDRAGTSWSDERW